MTVAFIKVFFGLRLATLPGEKPTGDSCRVPDAPNHQRDEKSPLHA
jgi:hypothetical protein